MSFDGGHVGRRLRREVGDAGDLERALWALVCLSLLADLVTTFVGLQLGLRESNPIARAVIDGWGVAGMVTLKGVAVAIALSCRPLLTAPFRPIVPAALAIPWTVAVVVNVAMISAAV